MLMWNIPPRHMTDGELLWWCYQFRDWATQSGHHKDPFPEPIAGEMRVRAQCDRAVESRFNAAWKTYMAVWSILGLY